MRKDASLGVKSALICGAGGFIGAHLVRRLKKEGYWVRGVDLKYPEYSKTAADEFIIGDLRSQAVCESVLDMPFDEVYQLAAEMGGAGYIFTGENDADIMRNSAAINLNVLDRCRLVNAKKIFYSSSACVYSKHNQQDPDNPNCREESAYPAMPDSEYGWEKLFSERLYMSYHKNYGIKAYIARFHNIFGPEGAYKGGREKAPAAICRKVIEAKDGAAIEVWGDGRQTRSFLYIDECLEGVRRLIDSDFTGPVNIGSEEMVSIAQLAELVMDIANKTLNVRYIKGPVGVRGRRSDNRLIYERLGWKPNTGLKEGLAITYKWIYEQLRQSKER